MYGRTDLLGKYSLSLSNVILSAANASRSEVLAKSKDPYLPFQLTSVLQGILTITRGAERTP